VEIHSQYDATKNIRTEARSTKRLKISSTCVLNPRFFTISYN
jgi:hypothetical protein